MATELATAYIQVEPSARGIKGKLGGIMDPEGAAAGESSGGAFGASFASKVKAVVSAAAIGKAISSIVSSGADYEQAVGGVETLFRESASIIEGYADEAYKSCGLSATAYMEQSTSFAASLVSSLGGDTARAAEMANTALVDMSDNANKMGTDLASIQNAYQGFAKQNFTMLDNLKLGYGGTQAEMQRLLDKAEEIRAAQGEATEYSMDSFADVVEAIHVVQGEMGIMGTTAAEASTTISGSLGMLRGAWQNLLTAISQHEGIDAALQGLSESLNAFVFNNLVPMLGQIMESLPQFLDGGMKMIATFVQGMAQGLPQAIPQIVGVLTQLASAFLENLPLMLDTGLQLLLGLVQGILNAVPVLVEALPQIITAIVEFFIGAIPQIIDAGIQLLTALIGALPDIISSIVAALPQIITGIVGALLEGIPQIIEAGVRLLTSLVQNLPTIIAKVVAAIPQILASLVGAIVGGIPQIAESGFRLLVSLVQKLPAALGQIVAQMPGIITGIVNALMKGVSKLAEVGKNLVKGLWQGIQSLKDWLWGKVSGWIQGIWSGIKNFFGISSPSREMAWIGEMLVDGLAGAIGRNGGDAVGAALEMSGEVLDAMSGLSGAGAGAELRLSAVADISEAIGLDGLSAAVSVVPNVEDAEAGVSIAPDIGGLAGAMADALSLAGDAGGGAAPQIGEVGLGEAAMRVIPEVGEISLGEAAMQVVPEVGEIGLGERALRLVPEVGEIGIGPQWVRVIPEAEGIADEIGTVRVAAELGGLGGIADAARAAQEAIGLDGAMRVTPDVGEVEGSVMAVASPAPYGASGVADVARAWSDEAAARLARIMELLESYLPGCAAQKVAVPVEGLDQAMAAYERRRGGAW